MRERYRRFSFLTDIEGMKNAIGEMRGLFFPKQPVLNRNTGMPDTGTPINEDWFIRTIKDKIAGHPEQGMEYPFKVWSIRLRYGVSVF